MRHSIGAKAKKYFLTSWQYGAACSLCALCACGGEQGGPPSGIAAAVTNSQITLAGVAAVVGSTANGQPPQIGDELAGSKIGSPLGGPNYAIEGSLYPPNGTRDIHVTIEGALSNGGNVVEDIVLTDQTTLSSTNPPQQLYLATATVPSVAGTGQTQIPASGTWMSPNPFYPTVAADDLTNLAPVILDKDSKGVPLPANQTTSYSFVGGPNVSISLYSGQTQVGTVTAPLTVQNVYSVTNFTTLTSAQSFAVRSGTFDVVIEYLSAPPAAGAEPAQSTILSTVNYTANVNSVNGTVTLSQGLSQTNSLSNLSVNVSDKQRGVK